VCLVVSEGWTGLGRAGLAGPRRQGLGWPQTRWARANDGEFSSGEFECARRSVVDASVGFIGAGAHRGHGRGSARRGVGRRRALARQSASNTWSFSSALAPQLTQVANVQILAKIRRESFPGT
jgi:hypothetical protein